MTKMYASLAIACMMIIYCKPKQNMTKRAQNNAPYVVTTSQNKLPVLNGEWIWYKTSCCGRNKTISTPETEGYTRTLWFRENNIVEYYKNNQLEKKINYSLSEKDNRIYIKLDRNAPAYLQLKGDSLVLNYGYMDLENEYYVKKK